MVKLNELSDNPGARKNRTRIGRGIGSGKGKTGGRGGKGQTARAGGAKPGFEGGQMPIYRRLPKRGFKNLFRKEFQVVNLDRLQEAVEAGKINAAQPITIDVLRGAGLVNRPGNNVRLLARGEVKGKLNITLASASKAAIEAVEKAGGTVTVNTPAAAE